MSFTSALLYVSLGPIHNWLALFPHESSVYWNSSSYLSALQEIGQYDVYLLSALNPPPYYIINECDSSAPTWTVQHLPSQACHNTCMTSTHHRFLRHPYDHREIMLVNCQLTLSSLWSGCWKDAQVARFSAQTTTLCLLPAIDRLPPTFLIIN